MLLILGMCFFVGGMRFREQMYNSTVTQTSACLLSLSVISLMLPTAFHASFNNSDRDQQAAAAAEYKVLQVSRGSSVILLLVYLVYLVFQLKSHAYMYESIPRSVIERESVPGPAAQYFNSTFSSELSPSVAAMDGQARMAPSNGQRTTGQMDSSLTVDAESQSASTQQPKSFLSRFLRLLIIPKVLMNNAMQDTGRAVSSAGPATVCVPSIVPIIVDDGGGVGAALAPGEMEEAGDELPQTSRTTAMLLLLISTGLVAVCAEFMVDSIDEVVADGSGGLSKTFIGLILLPIVGNAAEHITAVTVAFKNKMDLAIAVALGSSIQIALFVTPLVVILGWIMDKEMSLLFTLFETISMFVSAFIANFLVLDGRSNYLEGALLCASYVIIALVAFFSPDPTEASSSLGGGV
jgi:Ca2+:H+ antiporter